MNSLQKCQFEILKQTAEILDKNNFNYCLIGGTLLGAVRHRGFIPWDDDIDIGMPRGDYEKFAKIANNILPKDLFFQNKDTDKNYPYNFAKIRKNKTKFIQKSLANIDMHHGVFIDIFPIDGSSSCEKKRKSSAKKIVFLNYIDIVDTLVKSETTQNLSKKIQIFILKSLRLLIGRTKVLKLLNREIFKYSFEDSEIVGNILGIKRDKEYMPKSYFVNDGGKFSKIYFEGCEFSSPANSDLYLKHIYGNYMQLPPEEERQSHHQIVDTVL